MDSRREIEVARCLFRETNDALFVFEPRDHRIVDVNPTALRLTGFDRKDAMAMRIEDLFSSAAPDGLYRLANALRETQFFHSREDYLLARLEGEPLAVNVSVSRIHTAPAPLGLVVARDVSERRRAQEVLERFFQHSPALFAIVGSDGRFLKVNHAWEQVLGFTAGELLATTFFALLAGDDVAAAREAFVAMQGGEARRPESRLRSKGGEVRWVSWSTATAGGASYVVAQDITDQKRAEALRHAKEAAVAASRAKGEFLARVSHELRTPLTAILGLVDAFLEDPALRPFPADREEDLRTIRRNGMHLVSLIGDLLDLAKAEAGKLDLELVACRPATVAAEVAALLRARAAVKGIELSVECSATVPETFRTDVTRLRQILINLLGNAINFTVRGTVVLRLAMEECVPLAPSLRFDVVDTGIGLSPEAIPGLFRPFEQARPALANGPGGTGLGLAISGRLAELLGGTIAVQSEPGRGSTFSLTLPTAPPANLEAAGPRPTSAASAAEGPTEHPAPRLSGRVLLAEDHADNRRAISLRLGLAGLDVTAVADGQEALDLALAARAQGNPFVAILMDVEMPVLGGLEATSQLRSAGYDAPILAITANAMSEDRDECLRRGCDAHVPKPIDWGLLLGLIARLNEARKSRAPLT